MKLILLQSKASVFEPDCEDEMPFMKVENKWKR